MTIRKRKSGSVPTKRVTLADVAKLAGLSRTAASMILTGRPDTRLSEEAHAKVMAAAEQLGYRPNVAARSLRTERTQSIAFISDVVATTRYAMGLIRGALQAAEERGHVMLVLETNGEPARETEAINTALDRGVDGIIFAAMRAREINDYYNQLGEGLGKIVPPQVTSVSRKPLSISLEEIEVGKIEAVPLPPEDEGEEVVEASGDVDDVEPTGA